MHYSYRPRSLSEGVKTTHTKPTSRGRVNSQHGDTRPPSDTRPPRLKDLIKDHSPKKPLYKDPTKGPSSRTHNLEKEKKYVDHSPDQGMLVERSKEASLEASVERDRIKTPLARAPVSTGSATPPSPMNRDTREPFQQTPVPWQMGRTKDETAACKRTGPSTPGLVSAGWSAKGVEDDITLGEDTPDGVGVAKKLGGVGSPAGEQARGRLAAYSPGKGVAYNPGRGVDCSHVKPHTNKTRSNIPILKSKLRSGSSSGSLNGSLKGEEKDGVVKDKTIEVNNCYPSWVQGGWM